MHIYTEQDIIRIIEKYGLYSRRVSSNMFLIGLNRHYMFGNISIISNELICTLHFNAGKRRFANRYPFDETRFERDIRMATEGLIEKENWRIERAIDSLLR